MADRPLKIRELRKIMKRYRITDEPSRGKGSHTVFIQENEDGSKQIYTIPTSKGDISTPYIKGIRKRFGLTKEDGTSDKDFYGDK